MKYNIKQIENKVSKNLNPKRFAHTKRVMQTATEIGKMHKLDEESVKVAALLHDCAKNYEAEDLDRLCQEYDIKLNLFVKNNKELIHSILGAAIAKKQFKIEDTDILNAIKYHTTGRADMTLLEMAIYVSDFCEPGRKIPESKTVYTMAKKDLYKAMYTALNASLKYLLNSSKQIDPQSIECRNWLLNKI